MAYDHNGRLIKQVAARGDTTTVEDYITEFSYDGLNRITSQVSPEGQSVTSSYTDTEASGTTVSVTTANGLLTVSTMDRAGRLISVNRSGGGNDYGSSAFTYDSLGSLRSTLSPNGGRSYQFYDAQNRLQYSVDSTGGVTETTYDLLGRVDQQIRYATAVNTASWFSGGSVTVSTTQFEASWKPVANALDRTIDFGYDLSSRLISESDGTLQTQYTYDGLGRLISESSGALDGSGEFRIQHHYYDAANRKIGTVDAEGALVEYRYDAGGRMVEAVAYAEIVPQSVRALGFDTALAAIAASADDQHTHNFYDDRGQLVANVDGEGHLVTFSYDADGNLTQQTAFANSVSVTALTAAVAAGVPPTVATNADDQQSNSEFDEAGRVTQTTDYMGNIQQLFYNTDNQVVRIERFATDDTGTVRRQFMRYDEAGRLTGELSAEEARSLAATPSDTALDTAINNEGISRVYDTAGRLTALTDEVGNSVWRFYDTENRLRYSVNAEGEVFETRYTAFGDVDQQIAYATRISTAGFAGGDITAALTNRVAAVSGNTDDRITRYTYDDRGLLAREIARVLDTARATREIYTDYDYTVWGETARVSRATSFTNAGLRVATDYQYDLRGSLRFATQAAGTADSRTTESQYDAFGRMVKSIDALGREVDYEYDRAGRTIQVTDPLARTSITEYDAFDRVVRVRDALNRETTFDYNDATRTLTTSLPGGVSTVTRTNQFGETVEVIDQNGVSTRFEYDHDSNLTATDVYTTDGIERSTANYDAANRVILAVDESGREVSYEYDAASRIFRSIVDPSGLALETQFDYNAFGEQVLVTDPANRQTQYIYDLQGRMIETIAAPNTGAETRTRIYHDTRGRQVDVVTAAGSSAETTTRYVYDDLDQLTAMTIDNGGLSFTSTMSYDDAGNMIRSIAADGGKTLYQYDDANRLRYTWRSESATEGYLTEVRYDALDRVIESRIFHDVVAAQAGDVLNVTSTNGQSFAASHNVYDAKGDLRYNVDAEGYLTAMGYDGVGRQTQTRRFENKPGANTLSALDTFAANASQLSASVLSTTIYDDRGRQRTVTYSDGAAYQYEYDASGQMTKSVMPDSVSEQRYFTDAAGRQAYLLDSTGDLTRNVFDAAGNIVMTQRFEGDVLGSTNFSVMSSAEDVDAAMASMFAADEGRALATQTQTFFYDTANRLKFTVDGLGRVAEQFYDDANRLIETRRYDAADAGISQSAGVTLTQLESATNSADYRSSAHVYDLAGRKRFIINGGEIGGSYTGRISEMRYDAAGRVVSEIQIGRDYTQNGAFDLAAVAAFADATAAPLRRETVNGYDDLGRMVSMTDALGQTEQYEYDAFGNRTAVINKASHRWEYSYDDRGNLLRETSPSVTFYVANLNNTAAPSVTAQTQQIVTEMAYDYRGNVVSRTEGIRLLSNGSENRSQVTETTFGYDELGRQTTVSYRVGNGTHVTSETAFDVMGNAVANRDVRGNHSYKVYDAEGRLRYDIDAEGFVTETQYDAYDNIVTVTRYADRQASLIGSINTRHTMDSMAARFAAGDFNSADNRTITHTYDASGNRISTVATSVDGFDAVNGAAYTGAPETRFEYNGFGELWRESQLRGIEDGAQQWSTTLNYYDANGQRVQTVDAGGYLTNTLYNGFGQVSRVTEFARAVSDNAMSNAQSDSALAAPAASRGFLNGAANNFNHGRNDASLGADRAREYEYDALGRLSNEFMLDVQHASVNNGSVSIAEESRYLTQATDYDAVGNITRVMDADGNALVTGYDLLGRAIWTKDVTRDALLRTQVGNAFGLVAGDSITDGQATRSALTSFAYDVHGNLVMERSYHNGAASDVNLALSSANFDNANDKVTYYGYDDARRRDMVIDAEGYVTRYEHDASGNVTAEIRTHQYEGDAGTYTARTHYTFDALNRQITTEIELGAANQLAAAATGNQRIETIYNGFGEITGRGTSRTNYEETFVYDLAGRMVSGTAANGSTKTYSYDLAGNMIAEATPGANGQDDSVVVYRYDDLGRSTRVDRPFVEQSYNNGVTRFIGSSAEVTYDRWGNVVGQTERMSEWGALDANSTPISVDEVSYAYHYNQYDQMVYQRQPLTNVVGEDGGESNLAPTIESYYDLLGRQIAQQDARGSLRFMTYNSADQLISQTDALGNVTQFAYDLFGREVAQQKANGYITTTTYDRLDRKVAIGDVRFDQGDQAYRNQALVTHTYNSLGYQTSSSFVMSVDANDNDVTSTSVTHYDVRGNVIQKQSAAGIVTDYAYDSQGRRVSQRNGLSGTAGADVHELAWTYDYFGRMQTYNNLNGVEYVYVYEQDSGLLIYKGTDTQYANYDPNNPYADNSSLGVTYEYYNNGALKRLNDRDIGLVAEYEYDHLGRRTYEYVSGTDTNSLTNAPGTQNQQGTGQLYSQITRTTYDEHGRVYKVVTTDLLQSGGLDTMEAIYGYDENGNRRYTRVSSRYDSSAQPVNNNAPIPNSSATFNGTLTVTEFQDLATPHVVGTDLFTDPDGDTLVYEARLQSYRVYGGQSGVIVIPDGTENLPSWLTFDANGNTLSLDVNSPPGTAAESFTYSSRVQPGEYDIVLTARDPSGATTTRTFVLTVLDGQVANTPPQTTGSIPQVTVSEGTTIDGVFLQAYFFDPDLDEEAGERLSYQINVPGLSGSATQVIDDTFIRFSPGGNDSGVYTATVTATDPQGATAQQTFQIVVNDVNQPPVVNAGLANRSVNENATLMFAIPGNAFSDPDNNPLTYTATVNGVPAGTGAASWVTLANGQFVFSPGFDQAGSYTVAVTASDTQGESVSTSFTLTVQQTNRAPTVGAPIPNASLNEGQTGWTHVIPTSSFTDPDGNTLNYEARWVTTELVFFGYEDTVPPTPIYLPQEVEADLPSWLNFNPTTGTFSGVRNGITANETFVIRVRAIETSTAEAYESGYQDFTLQVLASNDAPVVVNAIAPRGVVEGNTVSFSVPSNAFSDPNGDALSYTATMGGVPVGTGAASWITLANGVFTLAPDFLDAGSYTVNLTANDGRGGSVSTSFTVTVYNNNRPPVVAIPIPNQSINEGTTPSFQIPPGTFSDPDTDDTLTYSATLNNVDVGTGLASWVTLVGDTFYFSPTYDHQGSYTLRVFADDGNGGVEEDVFTLTVNDINRDPTVANPIPTQSVNEGTPRPFPIPSNTFSDLDADTLQYTATLNNVAVGTGSANWVTLVNGVFTFSPNYSQAGSYTVRLTASDGRGGTAVDVFTLVVNNVNQDPIANTIPPQSVTEAVPRNYAIPAGTFVDLDGDSLNLSATLNGVAVGTGSASWVTLSGSTFTFSPGYNHAGSYTVRVTATDGNGGQTQSTFTLTVNNNNRAPTVANAVPNQTGLVQGLAWSYYIPSSTFTDPDGTSVSYSIDSMPSWMSFNSATRLLYGTPPSGGTWNVVVRGSDGALSVTDVFQVTARANSAPQINAPGVFNFDNQPIFINFSQYTSDADGDSVSYSLSYTPPGVNFNSSTGVLSGTPAQGQIDRQITVTASDGIASSSDSFWLFYSAGGVILNSVAGGGAELDSVGGGFRLAEEPQTASLNSFGSGLLNGNYYDIAWNTGFSDFTYSITPGSTIQETQKEYWYTYDAENRIKIAEGVLNTTTNAIEIASGQGSIIDYDSVGNQVRRVSKIGSNYFVEAFRYNQLGQLTRS
ncbi:MAG: putative Ig domain-containing protein, partial [Pseudomonadota bacterium]